MYLIKFCFNFNYISNPKVQAPKKCPSLIYLKLLYVPQPTKLSSKYTPPYPHATAHELSPSTAQLFPTLAPPI